MMRRFLSLFIWKFLPILVASVFVGRFLGVAGVWFFVAAAVLYAGWLWARGPLTRRGWYTSMDQIRARRLEQSADQGDPLDPDR